MVDKQDLLSKDLTCEFDKADWYKSLTLTERTNSLPKAQSGTYGSSTAIKSARRRLFKWRSESVFSGEESSFAERLKMDSINEDDLQDLLNEPAEALRDRCAVRPRWLRRLERAFSDFIVQSNVNDDSPHNNHPRDDLGLLRVVAPLLRESRMRLNDELHKLANEKAFVPFIPDKLEEMLFQSVPEQIAALLGRTMVLELNVARMQDLLSGETPEERFQSFVERLDNPYVALSILREYPVLARQVVICLDNWVHNSLEFAHRLAKDKKEIERRFGIDDIGLLTALEMDAGDSHRGGRSVCIASFSPGLRLVYKPRTLAVDVHFQQLLDWLNERGTHPPFKVVGIFDCETYGWMEYVESADCNSSEQVQRFYRRQGGYLALLHALAATDFHLENLIAAGEHPILIDLEALFHPNPPQSKGEIRSQQLSSATDALDDSVMRVGLLPMPTLSSPEQTKGFDLSGLGGANGQTSPLPLPIWEKIGTDEMRLARRKLEIEGGKNRPTLDGSLANPLRYTEDIVGGFTDVYLLLKTYRKELLSESGPLSRFADDEVRHIVRDTQAYGVHLTESFHPDLMRDALRRDRFFDSLWSSKQSNLTLSRTFFYERDDLQRGDIPVFTTKPKSRDLWSASKDRIRDFVNQSGLELSWQRIERFSKDDLAQQVWFIRASLTALALGEGRSQWPTFEYTEPSYEIDKTELLDATCTIGDRLNFLALRGEQDIAWLGLTLINESVWQLLPLGLDLYGGAPGVALFLAYLGEVTKEQRYSTLAEDAIETVRRQLRETRNADGPKPDLTIGAFNELGGIIYVFSHLGALWKRPDLLHDAEDLAKTELLPLIDKDVNFDILSGAAGCIGSLISLYRVKPNNLTLSLALKCGDHLIEHAQPTRRGTCWPSQLGPQPLAGFSHGAAGIGWALSELAALSGKQKYQELALKAFEYERSVYSHERSNWPDLRELDGQGTINFMSAWCHGAPGIGLGRVRALRHLDDEKIRKELEVAIATTYADGFGINHSLCHGAFGNLELLLESSRLLEDTELHSLTYRVASSLVESIHKQGWLCGVPTGTETPGLMTGLAGIGYGLLRLAEPDLVPSVLVLDSPVLGLDNDS